MKKTCLNCKKPISLPHWKYCDRESCERERATQRKRKYRKKVINTEDLKNKIICYTCGMKRSGFKQKTYSEKIAKLEEKQSKARKPRVATKKGLKRTTGAKKRTPTAKQIKVKLWNEVKRITRSRWSHDCYTCHAKNLEGNNLHAGHGKPLGALPLRFKYDIRNIRPQCMLCNIHRGGMSDIFIAKLEQEPEGLMFLQESCYVDEESNSWRIRQDIPSLGGKDATIFLENLLAEYKTMYL